MHFSKRKQIYKESHRVILLCIAALFVVLSGLFAFWLEYSSVEDDFKAKASATQLRLNQRIANLETVLISLTGLFHSDDLLSSAEQAAFSHEILKAYPFIGGVIRMDWIHDDMLADYENRMREDGFVSFRIEQETSQGRAYKQGFHLPISFVEPMGPLSSNWLGYDLSQQPEAFAAIDKAVTSGGITMAGPFSHNNREAQTYFVMKPLYLGRYPPKKDDDRMAMFSGMYALRIDLQRLSEDIQHARVTKVDLIPVAGAEGSPANGRIDVSKQNEIGGDLEHMGILSFRQNIDVYGLPFTLLIREEVGIGDINLWKIGVQWLLSISLLSLAVAAYESRKIARQQESEANAVIAAENARFAHVVDTAFEAVITADIKGNIVSWNRQASKIFGYSEEEVIGQGLFPLILTESAFSETSDILSSMLDPDDSEPNNVHLETTGRDNSDRKFALELVISSTHIGRLFILSVFARDVTERQRWNEKIRNMAYFDHLTKLPNRQAFKEHVSLAVNTAKRHNRSCAILYLDLDEFKRINDTLGHERGDLLLVGVSDRLVECLRGSDIVGRPDAPFEHERCIARLGGDEFTILLDNIDNPETIGAVTDRVIKSIAGIYDLKGHEVYVTTSIGIAIYPDDGESVEALLKSADTAMYHAKSVGKNNYQFYTSKMNALVASRLKLEGELRKALNAKEFKLYYQPQIDLVTRKIVSAEALLRFSRPELGTIPVLELIQIAEETGMIIDLGEWVFNEACRQNREWQDAGYPHMRISVNLSNMQFLQHDLHSRIESALKRHKLDPKYLGLEITESTVMQNVDDTINALTAFKQMGISISIDDFGTGHSSLSYLKRLPLDTLKIDRSFIKDTPHDPDDTTITSAIIAMAHRLNLEIVAEGIETAVQRDFLQQQGCQMGQGLLFSKPLPPEMFAELIGNYMSDPQEVSGVILPC